MSKETATEKKKAGRKTNFAEGEVGAAYIAEKVGTTPFAVREFLRAEVRDMSKEKGAVYRFTMDEANDIIERMKAKKSAPKKSTKGKAKKKAEPKVEKENVEDLEEIDSDLVDLEDEVDEVEV